MHVQLGCAHDRAFLLCVGSPCRNTVTRHAAWVGSRQRSSLSRQRFFGPVSLQGLGLNQVWVVTRVFLCRDRVFPRVGHSYCDKNSKGSVATGCFFVATHRAGLRTRQGAGSARWAWVACTADFSRLSIAIDNSLARQRIPE